jgi:hypothetical protein
MGSVSNPQISPFFVSRYRSVAARLWLACTDVSLPTIIVQSESMYGSVILKAYIRTLFVDNRVNRDATTIDCGVFFALPHNSKSFSSCYALRNSRSDEYVTYITRIINGLSSNIRQPRELGNLSVDEIDENACFYALGEILESRATIA